MNLKRELRLKWKQQERVEGNWIMGRREFVSDFFSTAYVG